MSQASVEQILERLKEVKAISHGWIALCPAHEDHNRSLKVDVVNGRTLVKCHAGCDQRSVITAIGPELFNGAAKARNGNGKGADRENLEKVAEYTYSDRNGKPVFFRDRYEWIEGGERQKGVYPRQLDGSRSGSAPVPYRLHRVAHAIESGEQVLLVEGEKSADALAENGFCATTTGSAESWRPKFAEHFRGARLVIWPDADEPGERYAAAAARDLAAVVSELRVLRFPNVRQKWDAADYFEEGGNAEQLERLLADAPEWTDVISPPAPEPTTAEDPSVPGQRRPLVLKRLLEGEPPTPPKMQIDQFLLSGDVNVLGGGGDAGKTTTMLAAAVSTAAARPLFGSLCVREPGPVVLVVPEDGEAVARHHVDALIAGLTPPISEAERAKLERDLHIIGDDRAVNLLVDTPELAERLAEVRPSLVILDPISSLIGDANENDESVAELVCSNLRRRIGRPLGAAILLAGHLRKPGRDSAETQGVYDVKGSAGWTNHARIVWLVTKPKGGDTITYRLVKANRLQTGLEHQAKILIDADPENAAHWLTCRLTDANLGSSSQAYTPGVGRAINDNEKKALAALDDQHEPGLRLSYSGWFKQSGLLNESTFKNVRDRLLSAKLAEAIPTGKKTRTGGIEYAYTILDGGRHALETGWK